MQRVIRANPNVSPIMDEVDDLYALLSDVQSVALIKPQFDESLNALVDLFCAYGGHTWEVEYHKTDYPKIEPINNDSIILAFSGGKDSIASALKYKEQGYNVYLYHLKHINPSFADEWKCAEESAKLLGLPIFIDDIRFTGKHIWTEHPMKNMIIANGALSYGVREGITTNIAFGNYTTSVLDENVFDRCAGDCVDVWETYEVAVQEVLPEFVVQMNLENMGETLETLADRRDLLDVSLSCLCRHSLRDYRRAWVKDKFGVDLFRRRCGSCYKCCVEYIYMADHNKMEYSEAYYKYCLQQLCKVAQVEGVAVGDIADLWTHFIFYEMSESRIADQLKNAVIKNFKIRY